MRITIEKRIYIDAPASVVWKKFSNLLDWPRFNPMFKYAEWVLGKPWDKGSCLEFFTDYGLVKSRAEVIILECTPSKSVTWLGNKKFIQGKHSFFFREEKGVTEVINHEEFSGIGVFLFWLLRFHKMVEKSFNPFLNGLKKECLNTPSSKEQ